MAIMMGGGGITPKKLIAVMAIFVFMITIGYMAIEGWRFLDALYMAMILMTTIGLGEARNLSESGRVFTIVYAFVNFILLAGIISVVSSAIVEGRIVGIYRRRRMEKEISRIKGHIVVCGAANSAGMSPANCICSNAALSSSTTTRS